MFWNLLPALMIGGQVCRVPPFSVEEWMDKKYIFTESPRGMAARDGTQCGSGEPKAKDPDASLAVLRQGCI